MSVDATLILIAPELEAVPAASRSSMIALAQLSVSTAFGDSQDLATAYLAAHMLTVSTRSGNAGAVKQVREGDLSISYGANESSKSKGSLESTSYGMEFLRLRRENIISARTRVC